MTFRLEKKSAGRVLTTFHIMNSAGDIVGSANIPNAEADNFAKHWRGPAATAANSAAAHARAVNTISNALRRGPRLSGQAARQAILRGC